MLASLAVEYFPSDTVYQMTNAWPVTLWVLSVEGILNGVYRRRLSVDEKIFLYSFNQEMFIVFACKVYLKQQDV